MRRAVVVSLVLTVFALGSACGARPPKPSTKPDPDAELAQSVRLADSYFQAGRTSEALGMLEKAIAANPNNAALQNYYGQMCFLAARYPQAEKSLRRAIELDNFLADAHNNLGAVLDRTGRKDEAEQEFRKALADPSYRTPEQAYLNLGLLYASQGRNEEAIKELRKAVETNPKFYRGHYELASLLDKTGKLDEAAIVFEAASPEYRNDAEYQYRLGFVYFRLDRPDKAKTHLTRCLEVAPGSENASKANQLLRMMK